VLGKILGPVGQPGRSDRRSPVVTSGRQSRARRHPTAMRVGAGGTAPARVSAGGALLAVVLGLGLGPRPGQAQDGGRLSPPPPPAGASRVPSPAPPGSADTRPEAPQARVDADAPTRTAPPDGGATDEGAREDGGPSEEDRPPGLAPRVTPRPPALRLVVVETTTIGIDPVVGLHIDAQLRRTGQEQGYLVIDPEDTTRAIARLRMPMPPTPADLWRLTYVAEAQRGVFARAWAQGGRYVVEVMVASLDGSGPFFERGSAGASDLRQVVATLLERALPPPSQYGEAAVARDADAGEQQSREAGRRATAPAAPTLERVAPPPSVQRRRRPREVGRRWQLGVQTESAFGTSQDFFYNHLLGVRLDYRIAADLLIGAYLGYANLRGKAGRTSSLLPMAQIENRVRLSERSAVTLPLKLAIGYLPFNGPVVRLAAGVNVPLSDRLEASFDLLTPTFWVLPDRTVVSLNVAAELVFRL